MPGQLKSKRINKLIQQFFVIGIFVVVFGLWFLDFRPLTTNAATPPAIITYQGKLLVNNLAATTTQSIKLVIYDSLTGGNALYTALGTTGVPTAVSVTPTSGIFSIDLGGSGTNTLDPAIFQGTANLYLEVIVGSETLTPRKQITASPFAYNALYLNGVQSTSTASSSTYIPVSDSSGNFSFNFVTSTGLKVNGLSTLSGAIVGSSTFGAITVTGSLKALVNITSTGILYASGGIISNASSSFGGGLQISGPVSASSSIITAGPFTLAQVNNTYDQGKFYIDTSGNISVSGTLNIFNLSSLPGALIGTSTVGAFRVSSTLALPDNSVTDAMLANDITASNYLLLAGGNLTGLIYGPGAVFGSSTVGVLTATSSFTSQGLAILSTGFISNASSSFGEGLQISGPLNASSSIITAGPFTLAQVNNTYDQGKFYVDTSGNVSVSGSFKAFSNVTSTGILYASGGLISNASSSFGGVLQISGPLNASSSIIAAGPFTLAQTNNTYDQGKFYIDTLGNVSASGTINITSTTVGYKINGVTIAFASTTLNNYFFGGAGNTTMTSTNNTAVGYQALSSMNAGGTGGGANVAIGYQALTTAGSSTENVAIGNLAMSLASGSGNSYNVAIGRNALRRTTNWQNVAVGADALTANTSGNFNVAVGSAAAWTNTTGVGLTAIGGLALRNNTTGHYNTAIGTSALRENDSGDGNTAIGYVAGYTSLGSNNTYLGYYAGYGDGLVSTTVNLTNAAAIGYYAQTTQSNSIILGGTGAYAVKVGIGTTAPNGLLTLANGGLFIGNGTTSSSLEMNKLMIASSTSNALGLFYVDSSGNASASGSFNAFGNVTSTGILYASGGLISSASSSFGGGVQVSGALNASSTLLVNGVSTFTSTSTLATTTMSSSTITNLNATNINVASTFVGAGLASCSASTSKLLWNSTLQQFSCGTDSGSNIETSSSTGSTTITPSETYVSLGTLAITPTSILNQVWATAVVQANNAANVTRDITVRIFRSGSCAAPQVGVDIVGALPAASTDRIIITASFVDSPSTNVSQNYTVCVKTSNTTSAAPTVTGFSIVLSEVVTGADLAEVYYSNDATLAPGEVVTIDTSLNSGVKRSSLPYDKSAIGIVSTRPGLLIGSKEAVNKGTPIMVALAGRVPIKITNKNGNIKAGDRLTSSDIPGVAMKATTDGNVVGVALEDYQNDVVATRELTAFVNVGWWLPDVSVSSTDATATDQASAAPFANISNLFSHVINWFKQIGIYIKEGVIQAKELIADKITGKELCVEDVCINKDQLKQLLEKNNITPTAPEIKSSAIEQPSVVAPTTAESAGNSTGQIETSIPVNAEPSSAITSTPIISSEPPPADPIITPPTSEPAPEPVSLPVIIEPLVSEPVAPPPAPAPSAVEQ